MPRVATALLLAAALALPALAGCENRKKACEQLFERIDRCNPKELKASKRARADFLGNCQKEFDKGTVKKTRECAKQHDDCAQLQQCIQQALQIKPKKP